MKVLFCTNAFEKVSNGPAKFAHLLLDEGTNADFEIRILTEDVTNEMKSVYKLNPNIHKPFKPFGQFIRMWKYHRSAMRIKKEYPFDMLVYNNAMIGLLSSLLFRKTVGMINDYTNAANSMLAVVKKEAALNKRVIFYYVEYVTCYFSKCIIVNSEYLKAQLQKHYNCRSSLFKVLHKGIENKLITSDRKNILHKKVPGSILFVKTDFVLGGLYTLIEALKYIDRKIILTIIGPAKPHHKMLENLLGESNIPFALFEYMRPDDVYQKMQQSEIFCVPSKREAFGVANLEAMALGCKIVSSNVGGIGEALNGNRFAWLVNADAPVALRAALNEALDTSIEKDLDDIAQHLDQFSSKKVVSGFREILQECL